MSIFSKILIANRGEIALRVIRTAKKMRIKTVAIYSQSDSNALHTQQADEAYLLGPDNLADSYLNINKIIQIAIQSKCEAIHPGYGFLSENPLFAEACEKAGIVFIGPGKNIIQLMGNKIEANQFVKSIGVPTIENRIGDKDYLLKETVKMDFPILLKAAAGGGGKGMRIVRQANELEAALEGTSREALNYFGNGTVYAEKYIENPRHIEVQILGDKDGKVIHLFERECSIQRRYQKIIEEAPSITLNEEVRENICNAAVEIGKKAKYSNAGTIEFLVDANLNFYFLEMNTRIQVEHPVTEMITGIDIVEQQVKIAAGLGLELNQDQITKTGHAIECRIYAEKPEENFMPSPGIVNFYKVPEGEMIRIESALTSNSQVFSFFDPMISKLVVWGENREIARHKMLSCLGDYIVHGVYTNIQFLKELIYNEDFTDNKISTSYCDQNLEKIIKPIKNKSADENISIPLLGFLLFDLKQNNSGIMRKNKLWNEISYWRHLIELPVTFNNKDYQVKINYSNDDSYEFIFRGEKYVCKIIEIVQNNIKFIINERLCQLFISYDTHEQASLSVDGQIYMAKRKNILIENEINFSGSSAAGGNQLISPMPGRVLKINTTVGEEVKKGTTVVVIESMKMENNITMVTDAKILNINVKEGELVDSGTVLVQLDNIE